MPSDRSADPQPLVSLILPVYNHEQYLKKCLDSVLAQKCSFDLEILLLNDGSTDSCPDICKHYAERDSRIRYITKSNSGLAHTRNVALTLAKGKYIQYLDSDDTLVDGSIELLARTMEETGCDMAVSAFNRVYEDSDKVKLIHSPAGKLTQAEYVDRLVKKPANYYFGVVWNKCYRTDFIRDNKVYFNQGVAWGEDFLFNVRYLTYAKNVTVIDNSLYNYLQRNGSLSSISATLKSHPLAVKRVLYGEYCDMLKKTGLYDKYKSRLPLYYVSIAQDR